MIEANPELLMNNALRGHIVLQYVNQTELQFSDIQGGSFPDRKTCIFYLSLRNLVANPQYLSSCTFNIEFERLILICYVDTPDVNSIEAVNKFCCLNAISLILAWDNAELGRYVETITVLLKETGIGECNNLDFLTITFSTLSEITCLNKLDVSTFIKFSNEKDVLLRAYRTCPSALGFAGVPESGT